MRTGIYGGSFNPIHNGHTHLATCLCNQGYTQEVWFMVSPCNPLKAHANDLLDETARLEMVRLATRHDPRLLACDSERCSRRLLPGDARRQKDRRSAL